MKVAYSGEEPAALRGAVIRAWREDAGVGLRELARRLGVSPGAVTMWETGQRATRSAANLSLVGDIAEKLGLSAVGAQAMKDMWLAAASVTALEPRSYWAHNFQWPSGPGWVWLRCPHPPAVLVVKGWWSDPIQGSLEMEVGGGGVFVEFPRTIPNPPLEVRFDGPVGWADFGKGRVPAGVAERLGAPVLDARTLPSLVKQSEPPLQAHVFAKLNKDKAVLGFKKVVEQFGPAWDLVRPHLGFARSDPPPHPIVNAVAGDVGVRVDDSGWIVSQAVQEPERFRLIREARGLSREAASAQATEMDRHHPVTASALRAYEETGAVPAVERFFSRLDAAYAADGHFGLDFVHDSRSRYPRDGIRFPTYWQGPIWLQIRGTGEDTSGLVDLTWGPWHRSQYVLAGTVLTTRKASEKMPPLVCELPAGWHVRAGVGAIPAGLDINHGWYPKDIGAAWGLITSHIKRLVHINRSDAVTVSRNLSNLIATRQ